MYDRYVKRKDLVSFLVEIERESSASATKWQTGCMLMVFTDIDDKKAENDWENAESNHGKTTLKLHKKIGEYRQARILK